MWTKIEDSFVSKYLDTKEKISVEPEQVNNDSENDKIIQLDILDSGMKKAIVKDNYYKED